MAKKILIILIPIIIVAIGLQYSSFKKGSMTPEEAFAREGGLRMVLEVEFSPVSSNRSGEVVDKMVEIIKYRVNQLGVRKALVQREDGKNIVVQLPGIEDVERVKRLVGRRALLEFKVVRDSDELIRALQNLDLVLRGVREGGEDNKTNAATAPPEEMAAKNDGSLSKNSALAHAPAAAKTRGDSILDEILPPLPEDEGVEPAPEVFSEDRPFTSYMLTAHGGGVAVNETNVKTVDLLLATSQAKKAIPSRSEFLWAIATKPFQGGGRGKTLYLVEKRASLTGRTIVNAAARPDPYDSSRLDVIFTLDEEGTVMFTKLTARIIGRQLAVVLDGEVCSAPVVQTKIPGGEARITGLESDEEANDLAIMLRSGSLPAAITIMEALIVPPAR
jgi:protein-export membrane protein SecD